ncbi:hypothetical protein [Parafilimonas sp.]|uniref:hypothetical protein n=1 Tax=Parafilimonas sp. TaxID=1969739 RepID=UPI0039E44550
MIKNPASLGGIFLTLNLKGLRYEKYRFSKIEGFPNSDSEATNYLLLNARCFSKGMSELSGVECIASPARGKSK